MLKRRRVPNTSGTPRTHQADGEDATRAMSRLPTFGRFFLPGPTEVRPEILAAQVEAMHGHRGADMVDLVRHIQTGLKYVFRTQRPVFISTSSATGLMEAALRNGARKRVLCLVNGAFSDRFHRIACACGLDADRLEVDWGQVNLPEQLEQALRKKAYDAVTVVHSETSTGALNPVAELAQVTHAAGDVVLLVDSVSGLAGAPVETDAWNLDVILTGSQKALALPPGLAFAVAQPVILERAASISGRGVYFDFLEFQDNLLKDQTPNTPAISLMYALAAQLEHIKAEGMEARWQRHHSMARRTWEWVTRMRDLGIHLRVLAPEGYRSPTVTCIALPPEHGGAAICRAMKHKGFTIAPGYGKSKDEVIRIGHMGDHSLEDLEVLLAELEKVLRS